MGVCFSNEMEDVLREIEEHEKSMSKKKKKRLTKAAKEAAMKKPLLDDAALVDPMAPKEDLMRSSPSVNGDAIGQTVVNRANLPPPPNLQSKKRAIRKAGEPVRDLSLPDVPSDERDPYSLQATAGYLSDDEEGVSPNQAYTAPLPPYAVSKMRPLLCKQGYLYKLSGKSGKSWKRRWFSLENMYLGYREKPDQEGKYMGLILLKHCHVRRNNMKAGKFSFEISHPNRSPLFLYSDRADVTGAWMKAIECNINVDKEMAQAEMQLSTLRLDCKNYAEEATEHRRECQALRITIKDQDETIKLYRSSIAKMQRAAEDFRKSKPKLEDDLKTAQAEVSNLTDLLSTSRSQSKFLAQECKRLKEAVGKHTREKRTLALEVKKLRQSEQSIMLRLQNQQAERQKLMTVNEKVSRQVFQLKEEGDILQDQLDIERRRAEAAEKIAAAVATDEPISNEEVHEHVVLRDRAATVEAAAAETLRRRKEDGGHAATASASSATDATRTSSQSLSSAPASTETGPIQRLPSSTAASDFAAPISRVPPPMHTRAASASVAMPPTNPKSSVRSLSADPSSGSARLVRSTSTTTASRSVDVTFPLAQAAAAMPSSSSQRPAGPSPQLRNLMTPTTVQRATSAQSVLTSPSLPRVVTAPSIPSTKLHSNVQQPVGASITNDFSQGRPGPSPSCPPLPSGQQHQSVPDQSQPSLWESVQRGLAERQKTSADYFQNMVRSRSEQRMQAHQQAQLPPQLTHQSLSAHQLSSHRNSVSSQGSDSSQSSVSTAEQQRQKAELLNGTSFPLFAIGGRQTSKSVMTPAPRFVGQNNAAAQQARRAAAKDNGKKFFDGFEMPSFGFKSKTKARQSAEANKMKRGKSVRQQAAHEQNNSASSQHRPQHPSRSPRPPTTPAPQHALQTKAKPPPPSMPPPEGATRARTSAAGHPQIFKAFSPLAVGVPQPTLPVDHLALASPYSPDAQRGDQDAFDLASAVLADSSQSHSGNSGLLTVQENDLALMPSSVHSDDGPFPRLAAGVTPGDMLSKMGGNEVAVSMDVLTPPSSTTSRSRATPAAAVTENPFAAADAALDHSAVDGSQQPYSRNPEQMVSPLVAHTGSVAAQPILDISGSVASLAVDSASIEHSKTPSTGVSSRSGGALLDISGAPVVEIKHVSLESPQDSPAAPLAGSDVQAADSADQA